MSFFSKFLGKHSNELRTIGNVLSTAFSLLPMTPDDKEKISGAIQGLHEAADSIEKSVKSVEKAGDVKIDKAALENAVSAVLPDLVAAAVAEAMKHVVSKPAAAGTVTAVTDGATD